MPFGQAWPPGARGKVWAGWGSPGGVLWPGPVLSLLLCPEIQAPVPRPCSQRLPQLRHGPGGEVLQHHLQPVSAGPGGWGGGLGWLGGGGWLWWVVVSVVVAIGAGTEGSYQEQQCAAGHCWGQHGNPLIWGSSHPHRCAAPAWGRAWGCAGSGWSWGALSRAGVCRGQDRAGHEPHGAAGEQGGDARYIRCRREQKYSRWEFPDWIPLVHKWTCLSESEAAPYLPVEEKSPLFTIQREGIEDNGALYRLNRFNSLQPHEERRDVSFFVGGPVWAMEWCPTPEGSPEGSAAPQYVCLYCHKSMDETHSLCFCCVLELLGTSSAVFHRSTRACSSADKAGLAYAVATDHGCVWDMKFCPSGAWEPPSTSRKHPQMSRLGLLAVAFSDGSVVLYSLPHPGALQSCQRTQVKAQGCGLRLSFCLQVQCTTTLQVGSIQAGSPSESGQCFSLSWMPSKPHHHLAAGFYDGTVAIWNLLTKSLLQRVCQPDGSLKLYPFQSFLAHDHAVRSIEWCKANSNFLVTAGNDRKIKFWDLRRLYEPINSIKRFLSTEVAWLLPYNGVTVAQDNCYASYGLCGIHYIDAGYLGFKAYFVAPRKGTVWSISGSDWLNTVAAGDITGELVAAVLPDLAINPLNVKRSSDRRFPVYKADLLPCGPTGPENGEQALPKTRLYSEMVAKAYIRFRDTDLV
ncbi:General transcription factor 3C polypeptide 2 [Anas platyrhynchos]|uniref:General transcription factor 3C polypeptide 2 n=1 Tax=Anas platyrhynchos TaxID=8839 RepID=R0J9T4_ANAPL|nr:General transcription factor 3C polypeptide 2 [Anas platyrhynchos]